MAVYKPLFVYLSPASIPQVVAHIQQYLADNPIISDPEVIAEAIQKYIEEHPELIAVASVNGKTGNVVLTGSDININASSAVSIETQLSNLASMIQSASGDITQIESQLETIYTNIETIETNVSNNTTAISALQTSVEGQGTRLATAENDIDSLESAQSSQNTRLNTAEGDISSLQTRMTQAETDIDSNEGNIATLQTFCNGISSFAGLRVEFGEIAVQGSASGGEVAFTFNQPFTTTPFIALSVNADTGRMIGMHTNGLTNTGGTLVIRRILDGSTTPGWAGNAVVRYMAIGT